MRGLRRVLCALLWWMLLASGAQVAGAEPWLSTRFAQNCASCHAPGRKGTRTMDRRCTLSCQGCHVNPNGGGLRNTFGKWNEDRVLRSFRTDALRHEHSVAPTRKQHYGHANKNGGGDDDEKVVKGKDGKEVKQKKRKRPKKAGRRGFPLVELEGMGVDEDEMRRDGRENDAVDRKEFLANIPEGDPYRVMDQSKVDGGGSLRWQATRYKKNGAKGQFNSFLMAADFGVRARPFYRQLSLVYEARFLGTPQRGKDLDDQLVSQMTTRDAYALVDDLPFNTFMMAGIYKPLFGNFTPDHYQLGQEMVAFAQSGQPQSYGVLFRSATIGASPSFGTSPAVPYVNFHLVNKRVGDEDDKTRGFASNVGVRIVPFGASLNYSYWRADEKLPEQVTAVEMHAVSLAGNIAPVVASIEALSVKRDVDTQDFRQGGVYTLDTMTRVWRETYATLLYARANTTSEIKPGNETQAKAGVRSFLAPGVDLSLYYEMRQRYEIGKVDVSETTTNGFGSQLHLFF